MCVAPWLKTRAVKRSSVRTRMRNKCLTLLEQCFDLIFFLLAFFHFFFDFFCFFVWEDKFFQFFLNFLFFHYIFVLGEGERFFFFLICFSMFFCFSDQFWPAPLVAQTASCPFF